MPQFTRSQVDFISGRKVESLIGGGAGQGEGSSSVRLSQKHDRAKFVLIVGRALRKIYLQLQV